jgi:hypothetical protein
MNKLAKFDDVKRKIPIAEYSVSNCKLIVESPSKFLLKYNIWNTYPCISCERGHKCNSIPNPTEGP